MTYVLGIDPGGTSGLCLLEVPEGKPVVVRGLREIEGGIEGFLDAIEIGGAPGVVVCESFALDGRTPKPDLTPVEIIGALKALKRVRVFWGQTELVFQTNTQGKHMMTNAALKRAGYYPKRGEVKGGHGVDALRHALNYVVTEMKHRPTQEKIFPRDIEGSNAVE